MTIFDVKRRGSGKTRPPGRGRPPGKAVLPLTGLVPVVFQGILDTVIPMAAAVAHRRLSSLYTGPLFRVRRQSDSTELDIPYLPNGDPDLAVLAAFIGGSSAYVRLYYDQTGNGLNFGQNIGAEQPRIANLGVFETLNGRLAAGYFNGNFDVASPSMSSRGCAIVQQNLDTPTFANYRRLIGQDDNWVIIGITTNTTYNPGVPAIERDITPANFYRNGVLTTSAVPMLAASSLQGTTTIPWVGAVTLGSAFGAVQPWNGMIAEAIIFANPPLLSTRIAINSNQMAYYSL